MRTFREASRAHSSPHSYPIPLPHALYPVPPYPIPRTPYPITPNPPDHLVSGWELSEKLPERASLVLQPSDVTDAHAAIASQAPLESLAATATVRFPLNSPPPTHPPSPHPPPSRGHPFPPRRPPLWHLTPTHTHPHTRTPFRLRPSMHPHTPPSGSAPPTVSRHARDPRLRRWLDGCERIHG